MEEFVYYTLLFDVYGELLTEKQQLYFKEYYFNNLSLGEIAENYQVSRNAIHKQLKEAIHKLERYEEVLALVEKNKRLEKIVQETSDSSIKEQLKIILDIENL